MCSSVLEAGSLAIVPRGPEHRMVLSTCVLVRRAKDQPDTVSALLAVLQAMYAARPEAASDPEGTVPPGR